MENLQRLDPALAVALAWQPRESRPALAALFSLDRRLSAAIAQANEPLLAHVRLTWWRERLAEAVTTRPTGEPLLEAIGAHWGKHGSALTALVEGWERWLTSEPLTTAAIGGLAEGRGEALAAFARLVGSDSDAAGALTTGRNWALADVAGQRAGGIEECAEHVPVRARSVRGVAVLGGLARRALDRHEPLMHGRAGALAAIRLGMFGG